MPLELLMPMGGRGVRFEADGATTPKPLIMLRRHEEEHGICGTIRGYCPDAQYALLDADGNVSGTGWVPSITFVFLVSTRKIFANNKRRIPLVAKYAVWLRYQLALVVCVSFVAQWLFSWASGSFLAGIGWLAPHLGLLSKIAITPFTMTANFFAMRFLSEKL